MQYAAAHDVPWLTKIFGDLKVVGENQTNRIGGYGPVQWLVIVSHGLDTRALCFVLMNVAKPDYNKNKKHLKSA